jgi:hypothetical protein
MEKVVNKRSGLPLAIGREKVEITLFLANEIKISQ